MNRIFHLLWCELTQVFGKEKVHFPYTFFDDLCRFCIPECPFHFPGAPQPPPVDPCLPKFQCRLSGQCISRSQVCDFVSDCPGGTDEEQAVCGYPQGFEKSIEPWKHSKDDSYEWQLWKGSTQSAGTGPKTDARGDAKGMLCCAY